MRRAARRRALASFRNYARTSVDFVWQYGVPAHAMHRHFRAYGLEHAHAAIEEHGGGVFALAHFGSWDVAAGMRARLRPARHRRDGAGRQ